MTETAKRRYQPYTTNEMILMAKCAQHRRSPRGMAKEIACTYDRTYKSVTQQISMLRKSGEYKYWLTADKQIQAHL